MAIFVHSDAVETLLANVVEGVCGSKLRRVIDLGGDTSHDRIGEERVVVILDVALPERCPQVTGTPLVEEGLRYQDVN